MSGYTTEVFNEAVTHCDDFEELKKDILSQLQDQRDMWAEKIEEILKSCGCTVQEFADRCGVSKPAVQKWRKGSIPQSRDMFLRIGFAAGFDLSQMNAFLQRYGRCPQLYIKSPEDSACIFALNSKTLPHTYETCQALQRRMHEVLMGPSNPAQVSYPTEQLMDSFQQVSTEDELLRFVQENAASYREAYHKFYSFVRFCLDENRSYQEVGENGLPVTKHITIQELAQEQNWSSSLRKCVSEILSKRWTIQRSKVISLGLHLNMDKEMINQMLECAQMEGLYAKNPAEMILIFALMDYEMNTPNEKIPQDGSSELFDLVKDYLTQAHLADADFLVKQL